MNTLHLKTKNGQIALAGSNVDVHFDGFMEETVRCEVVKEMMKFVLYETGQIPMAFNQIKELNNHEKKLAEEENAANKKPGNHAFGGRIPMQHTVSNPQAVLIESVNTLCETIQQVFGSGGLGTIRQVLFLLGNSVSLPRHTILLNLPATAEGGEVIKSAASLRVLFHALMVEDLLYGAQTQGAALTKLFVLFLAPRSMNAQKMGLQPCLTFKLAGLRGKLYTINFLCKYKELTKKKTDLDLSSDWEEFEHDLKDKDDDHDDLEISGIVPFSPFPKPFQRPSDVHKDVHHEGNGVFKVPQNPCPIVSQSDCEEIHSTSTATVSSVVSVSCVQSGSLSIDKLSVKDDDFIWYQASVSIKGYTEKQKNGHL